MSAFVTAHENITNQGQILRGGFRSSLSADTAGLVFIINDDASVRERLRMLMWSEGWQPETYASAQEFLIRPRAVVPNCLVLDVSLSGLNRLDLQKRIATERPDMQIILMADHVDVPTTVKAMKAGAVEFFTKPFRDDLLLNSIRKALDHSRVAIVQEAQARAIRVRYALLTARECQVMALVVSGLLNKQVGGELGISEKTVKVHRGQVMQKMNASSLADLVKKAVRLGVTV
jgi:FixJ family two-component response regulator